MPCRAALKTLALALFCLCPAIALGQEKIRTVKVGPYGDQVRIVVTLIDPTADGYKMQSLIIDLTTGEEQRRTALLRPCRSHLYSPDCRYWKEGATDPGSALAGNGRSRIKVRWQMDETRRD